MFSVVFVGEPTNKLCRFFVLIEGDIEKQYIGFPYTGSVDVDTDCSMRIVLNW